MDFDQILDRAIEMLQRRGRMSYRALKRQFDLDDDTLEDLKVELLYSQPPISDDHGKGLIWTRKMDGPPVANSQSDEASQHSATPQDQSIQAEWPPVQSTTPHDQLPSERRQVTIVFADISGFTALSEQLDPEAVRNMMNSCFTHLVPIIERYGGTIDKFIGDEIMALFGQQL